MKPKNNSQKGFAIPLIMVIVILILGVGGFILSRNKSVKEELTNGRVIILSPNGRETFSVGLSRRISYNITENVTPKHKLLISLEPGSIPLGIASATSSSYNLLIPSTVLVGGDAQAPITPGEYKLRVSLYDGEPCVGLCPTESTTTPKLIAYDETDGFVTVAINPALIELERLLGTTSPVVN